MTPQMLREQSGYVMQDDSHLVRLTVKETLTFSALLRLPAEMPKKEKMDRVDRVLGELGLWNVAETRVGGGFVRGVSGGERRRVSIGVQLLKDPSLFSLLFSLLFSPLLSSPLLSSPLCKLNSSFPFLPAEILLLDEPTTGLDAFTANNIVTTLSNLAKQNKTVIFTIHQPRSDVFPILDTVMLLSQGRSAVCFCFFLFFFFF